MEGIQKSELGTVFFYKIFIEVCEFYLYLASLEGIIVFIFYSLLGLEHRVERLHVWTFFRIVKILSCCLGFKIDSSSFIESRVFNMFGFCSKRGWSEGFVGSEAVFSDGAVSDWSIGWVLPDGFKHL